MELEEGTTSFEKVENKFCVGKIGAQHFIQVIVLQTLQYPLRNLYIYIYIYIYMYTYMHTYIHTHMHRYIHMRAHLLEGKYVIVRVYV
jgi:hypothetical protein